jgi:putative phosphoesterase
VSSSQPKSTLIGVISDTHGLLRPEAAASLEGVDLILHAGDVGSAEVIQNLQTLAPVIAVRGNNDKGEWASGLPEWEVAQVGPVSIYLIHDLKEMDISPSGTFEVVVSGHSHKPAVETRRGVVFVNPGSAGPRRFSLPVTIARIKVSGSEIETEIVDLLKTSSADYADS